METVKETKEDRGKHKEERRRDSRKRDWEW